MQFVGRALGRPFTSTPGPSFPNHMHCLWTVPPGNADFPERWCAIEIAFVKCLPAGESPPPGMTSRGERGIWQRRYWETGASDEPPGRGERLKDSDPTNLTTMAAERATAFPPYAC